jgi:Uma2 family endonuclease
MSTTQISVEEYLKTPYDPDCEYLDGVIQQRAIPELDHASWQGALLHAFRDHKEDWNILAYPSLTIQITPTQFRIPDVSVLSRSAPREQVITHPPLAVFEILSPTDRMTDVLDKLAAYQQMGIPAIWVIEPRKPTCYRYSSGQLTPATTFELPGSSHRVAMAEIAALVD